MRKIYLLLLLTVLSVVVKAQSTANYAFATNTTASLVLDMNGNAIDMSTGTAGLITTTSSDQGVSTVTNIGFDFWLMSNRYSQFSVSANGIVQLGSSTVSGSTYVASGGTTTSPKLSAFGADLGTSTSGSVKSKIVGTAPNRCLVIEFSNMTLLWTSAYTNDGTFQTRLYESGVVEFVYGTMSITSTASAGDNTVSIGFSTNTTANNFAYVTSSTNTATTSGSFTDNPVYPTGPITNLNSAADGSRRVYRFTPPSTLADVTALNFTSVAPGSMTLNWTAASPVTGIVKYAVYRSTDAGVTYTFVNTVNVGTNTLAVTGLTPSTSYTWKVVSVSEGFTSAGITGTQATTAATTYTWSGGAGPASWALGSNWTPTRNTADASDIMVVNTNATITNVPTQTISRLSITGNAIVNLQAAVTSTLTIASDGTAADELSVTNGSSLISNGTAAALTITYSGTGSTGNIAGNMEAISATGSTTANTFNFTGGTTSVTTITGTLAAGQSGGTGVPIITGTAASLIISGTGTYNHKFTTVAGTIPTATWQTNSTCLISGYTSNATPPSGILQTFSNFTWNCPSQTGNINLSGSVPTVNGIFTMASTGAGVNELRLSGTTAYTVTWGNFSQSGGILDLANGASGTDVINILGTFNQSGGTFKCSGTGTTSATLNFNGSTGGQSVTFTGQPSGPLVYRISNTAGITLNGNVANFAIGNGTLGGIRVSVVVANPITLGGSITGLQFNAANSTLTYDASTGTQTATATEFPVASGPANLVINNTAAVPNRFVSIPFNRTVGGTLTLTSGDINMGANTLTLGTSTASVGTLSVTSNVIIGKFKRWVNVATGTRDFPVGVATIQRNAAINYTVAPGTGGTLTAEFILADPGTAGLPLTEGAINVNTASKFGYWKIDAGDGLAGGTYTASITARSFPGVNSFAGLVLLKRPSGGGNWSLDGTHVTTTGSNAVPVLSRTGIATGFSEFGVGADVANNPLGLSLISITTGNWEDASTWSTNTVPTSGDNVTIANTHTVTVNLTTASAGSLVINSGGTLTVSGNTLTVGNTITNNGTINSTGGNLNVIGAATTGITNVSGASFTVSGGTVTMGIGGNNRTFANAGTLTVSSGTLNINGNLTHSFATGFNQSGGNINIDGNSGVVGTSVASGTAVFSITAATGTVTGGTITIVDPNFNASGKAVDYNVTTTSSIWGVGHTLRIGNGLSADPSSNTSGYILESYTGSGKLLYGNLQISGGSTTNHHTSLGAWSIYVGGVLTIDAASELVNNSSSTSPVFSGDIINNGTMTSTVAINLAATSGTTTVVNPGAQTISGAGTFRNLSASQTANLTGLTVNNNNATGITLNVPLSISGTLTLTSGLVNTTSTNLLSLGTATAAGTLSGTPGATNMIVGPFARTFAASRTATGTYTNTTLFPVGKGATYLPINIDPSTNAGGSVILTGEAFTSNSGTLGSGVTSLSTNRWEALATTGSANLTNSFIRLTDAGIVTTNKILQSSSAAGSYTGIPSASTFVAGPPVTLTTATSIPSASYLGYFAYGNLTNCIAPTDQPTVFGSSNLTTTSFTGSFTLATSTPSHYLVVRYPSGGSPTAPTDFNTYTVGGPLGAGTVVANVVAPANTYNVTGLTAATTYDIYIYSYNNSGCFGPVYNITTPLSGSVTTCAAVTGTPGTPTSSLVTSTSFTASWTASSTSGVDYILDVATNNTFTTFVPGYNALNVGTGTLSYNINSGLSPNVTYYVRVRAVVGGCTSANTGTLTVTTDCTPFTPVYTQDFATYIPTCWKEQTGYLTVSPSSLTGTTSAWTADGWLNAGSAGAAKINLYDLGKRDWLISPSIDLGGLGNYQLEFDLATLTFAGTGAAGLGSDDSLAVVISTDNGATWSTTNILNTWTAANTPVSATGLHVTIPLTSYTGVVKFGFYGSEGAINDVPDVDVMIDNFAINVQPACAIPSAVSVGSITQTSASVNFTSGGTSFIVEYGLPGFTPGTGATPGVGGTVVTGTSSPIGISGLSALTTYNVYVRQVCDGPIYSANSPVVSFSTPFVINSFPYCQDLESTATGWSTAIASGSVNDWVIGTPAKTQIAGAHGGTKAYVTNITSSYSNSQNAFVLSPTFDFSALTGNPTISFWHNFKTEAGFDAGVLEYSTNGGSTWTKVDATLGTGGTFNTTNSSGWYNSSSTSGPITQPKWSNTSTAYTGHTSGWIQSSSLLIGFNGPSYSNVRFRWRFGTDGSAVDEGWAIDDICVDVLPPSCPATFTPANNASICSSASATTLSWTAGANATGYDVYFDPGAGPATTLVSSNQPGLIYNAGVLAPGTYSWRIVARGNGTSTCSNLTFTVVAAPTINIAPAGPVNICAPATQTLTLGATNASSPTYQWKNNGTNISGQTGTSYVASASGNYSLTVSDGVTGCSSTSNIVTVTINPQPSAVTVTPSSATICPAGPAQLLTASGGTINVTGSPVASSGTAALDGNPYRTFWDGGKVQFIYTAAELSSAGFSAGSPINALAFDVTSVGDPLPNFTIEMKHITGATFSGTTMETGMTTVFTTASPYQPVLGINTHIFTTPFIWNGTDNIVFSTCFGTSATGSSSQVRAVPTISSSVLQSASDLTTCATTTGSTNATRPFIVLTSAQSVNFTWTPNGVGNGLFTDAGATTVYTGGPTATVYALPTANTTYTATATTGAGCTNSNTTTITVLPPNTLEWTGAINTDWNNPGNWTCNTIPAITSNVIIKSGLPNYPVIALNIEIKSLTAQPGASVTVNAGFELKLNGQ